MRQGERVLNVETKTISGGVLAASAPHVIICAETGTADDLNTLTMSRATDVTLFADTGDTITLKDGTGNLDLGADVELTDANPVKLSRKSSSDDWQVVAGKAGADGAAGVDTYAYVAYASADDGSDWNLTPSSSLKYRAEIHSATELTPVESDFSGATWVKYIGDDGSGGGGGLPNLGTDTSLTISSGAITPSADARSFKISPTSVTGTLASAASATDTSITLGSGEGAGFSAGDRIKITEGATEEWRWIKSISTDTITVYYDLDNSYTDAATVRLASDYIDTITATNLTIGDVFTLSLANAGDIINIKPNESGGNITGRYWQQLSDTDKIQLQYVASGVFQLVNPPDKQFYEQWIFFDSSMSAATIQSIIGAHPKKNPHLLNFQFLDGTYTLDNSLVFNGFSPGQVFIFGNSGDSSIGTSKSVVLDFSGQSCNGLEVRRCSDVTVAYLDVKVAADSVDAIYSQGNIFFYVALCYLHGASGSSCNGISCRYNPAILVSSTNISYTSIAIKLDKSGCSLDVDTIAGSDNTTAIKASRENHVTYTNSTIAGAFTAEKGGSITSY